MESVNQWVGTVGEVNCARSAALNILPGRKKGGVRVNFLQGAPYIWWHAHRKVIDTTSATSSHLHRCKSQFIAPTHTKT